MHHFFCIALLFFCQDAPSITRGPYLQNVTPDSIVICWETNEADKGQVEFGTDPNSTSTMKGSQKETAHHIALKNLKPSTSYRYRVLSGKTSSDWSSFKTSPAKRDVPVFLIAFGDTRSGDKTHRKVAERIAEERPDFIVHSGDLVYNGREEDQWDTFFSIEAPLLRSITLFPSLGNHEHDAKYYYDAFVLPGEETYYSFDYGNLHFTVLDSNRTSDEKQKQWLVKDLKEAASRFKIAVFHHAIFSTNPVGARMDEGSRRYKEWGKIFEDGGVKLLLMGHNHNYQRAEHNGITYITTGGGGAPLYPVTKEPLPQTKFTKVVNHYVRVKYDGKKCLLEAVDLTGEVFDTSEVR